MLILGLTGNIASGKSTVANLFKDLGAEIIDADDLARSVVNKGKPAWTKIIKLFGDAILDKNGLIDRKELGRIVFNDKDKLQQLIEITHPEILNELKPKIEYLKLKNTPCVVIEATLIDEQGAIRNIIDKLIVVHTSQANQISRLMKRNNHTLDECMQRINSQIPVNQESVNADYIINNDPEIDELKKQVLKIWNDLFRK